MNSATPPLGTGLEGLDRVLGGVIAGDNIVWQVQAIEDYAPFIPAYCQAARAAGQELIYFRFARHAPLLEASSGASIHTLDPTQGFESFIAQIHKVIGTSAPGGFYVFDCLSDLATDWCSDEMLGNFFMLTCPFLFDVEAVAYFGLLRGRHSPHAVEPINETAQVVLNVYRYHERLYVHPLKVQQRYSRSMYAPHLWDGDQFRPIHDSAATSEILSSAFWLRPEASGIRLGVWEGTFARAQQVVMDRQSGRPATPEDAELLHRLLRTCVSRDERVLQLAQRYLTLQDVLDVSKRVIGTGLIGGKSVGMLLARAILRARDRAWEQRLEPHDSFFVASDVFYSFLVRNGIWWVREKQRNPATVLEGAERARQRMITGTFPEAVIRQFEAMLEYFGQSPIIVRSSSLLEDAFGNAFAGKYDSVFCANQGPRAKRLEDFLSAVRRIYASTMSRKALTYRAQRGMLDRDEQMALLVQRVSGSLQGEFFYPHMAGVGFSHNSYVWSDQIDPAAGMLRLVFGLGTRAVDRRDDDYTRVVALNAPTLRPEESFDKVRRYSQKKTDVLDLGSNQLTTLSFGDIVQRSPRLPLEMLAWRDHELEQRLAETGQSGSPWVLTFDGVFRDSTLVQEFREMLAALQATYGCPVDIEFTVNWQEDQSHRINLLQCRPLAVHESGSIADPPADLAAQDRMLVAHGAVIGRSRVMDLGRIIYVVPSVYGELPLQDRYALARLIGQLTHLPVGPAAGQPGAAAGTGAAAGGPTGIMLLGPGRWGTTTPSLGVPVTFPDINTVSVVCEIVAMRGDIVPDVSLGTHFFADLVEMDVLYVALFPSRPDSQLNTALLETAENQLARLLPQAAKWAHALRVIDAAALPGGPVIRLNANNLKQRVVCYLDRGA